METSSYEARLETKLITEFKDLFYEKLGYYPIVLAKNRVQENGTIPVMSLEGLKKMFDPFLPFKFDGAIPLDSKIRERDIVELRIIYCFLARAMKYNLKAIGRILGNRDHTTVIYNVTMFNNLIETNENFREKYFTILNYIKTQHEPPTMDHPDQVQYQSQSDLLPGLLQK
jgi:hypothetical protein